MLVLGLLLLAASVGAAVSIAVSNTDSLSFEVFGQTVTSMSAGGLMLLGIGLGVAALVGLAMMNAGMRRNRRRREADRQTVQQTRSRVDELEEENVRLRQGAQRHEVTAPPLAATSGHVEREQDTVVSSDRDEARAEAAAETPAPVGTRPGEAHPVYPTGSAYTEPGVNTPAFEETARDQGNRVFGRHNR